MPLAGDTTLDNYVVNLTSKVRNIDGFIDNLINKNSGLGEDDYGSYVTASGNKQYAHPSGFILGKIKIRLWNKGTDGAGVLLQSKIPANKQKRSARYRANKKKRGYRSEPTNLRVKGDFYRSFYVKSKRGVITVDSKISGNNPKHKVDKLFGKFGENILSLSEQEQQEFINKYLIDNVTNWMLENLNKNIIILKL